MEPDKKYLSEYRLFFENFICIGDTAEQFPVKLNLYDLNEREITGGIVYWTIQYLNQKQCPEALQPLLTNRILDEVQQSCQKQPVECGFRASDNVYEPLKLMQFVTGIVNSICNQYLDNTLLDLLPPPNCNDFKRYSCTSTKNIRRKMEDRHVALVNLNATFGLHSASDQFCSFYGVFDGHAGHEAAVYAAAHLPQYLVESSSYGSNMETALREAFLKTDEAFVEKSRLENLRSGTTAVTSILQPGLLTVAWVGDSQALLVKEGRVLQIVEPHKPTREDERKRIEDLGGFIIQFGIPRVNGQLAVSRAIGNINHKPYVSGEPDIKTIRLDGHEDFLILASDGLWDYLSEDHVATFVYDTICSNSDNTDICNKITQGLVSLAKQYGSTDNITVMLVLLKPTKLLASQQLNLSKKMTNQVTTENIINNDCNENINQLNNCTEPNQNDISNLNNFAEPLHNINCNAPLNNYVTCKDSVGSSTLTSSRDVGK